jgi:hypothetical protein
MSQLAKTLKTRIDEITAAIEAQTTELAAYRAVLEMEVAKDKAPAEPAPSEVSSYPGPVARNGGTSGSLAHIPFTGNKTTLVAEIVKGHGKAGAAPKDVEKVFTDRKIERSKNLVYNTLSYLVAQKKLQRRDGRYFGIQTEAVTPQNGGAPTKRRISPAGIKRIREAMKKRWAAKKSAPRAAAK